MSLIENPKKQNNNFIKALLLYSFGNIFNRAISLLLLPVITRLLSTSDYGIVSTYISWHHILVPVIGMQLGMSIRPAFNDKKSQIYSFISSIYFLIIIWATFISIVVLVIIIVFEIGVPIGIAMMCLFHGIMSVIINGHIKKLLMEIKYVQRTLFLSIPNLLVVIISIILLSIDNTNGYMKRIFPYVIVYGIIGNIILIRYFIKGKKFIDYRNWKYALIFSLPLIFHELSKTILATSDRTIITIFRTTQETGIYSIAYTMGLALTIVTSSLDSIWIPWFTKKMNENRKLEINNRAKDFLLIGTFFTVLSIFGLSDILKIFSSSEYWGGTILVPIIVSSTFFIFLYSLPVNLEYYYKRTNNIAISSIAVALMNIILNIIFIPHYGGYAAAFTTLFSYITLFVFHNLIGRKIDKELFPFKIYLFPVITIFCSLFFSIILEEFVLIRWIIILVVISISILLTINRYKKIKGSI